VRIREAFIISYYMKTAYMMRISPMDKIGSIREIDEKKSAGA